MARFTIYQQGTILGTYSGDDENGALEALAKDLSGSSFKEHCKKKNISRDDHKVVEVKE